jgi:hypothetical protein
MMRLGPIAWFRVKSVAAGYQQIGCRALLFNFYCDQNADEVMLEHEKWRGSASYKKRAQ